MVLVILVLLHALPGHLALLWSPYYNQVYLGRNQVNSRHVSGICGCRNKTKNTSQPKHHLQVPKDAREIILHVEKRLFLVDPCGAAVVLVVSLPGFWVLVVHSKVLTHAKSFTGKELGSFGT